MQFLPILIIVAVLSVAAILTVASNRYVEKHGGENTWIWEVDKIMDQ